MRLFSLCIVFVALGSLAGCSSETAQPVAKPVAGEGGRERWVVSFNGAAPDLTEYRTLASSDAAAAELLAEKLRKQLLVAHADFEASLQAVSGRIVETWWMANAVTVEVEGNAVPSLRGLPGVKDVAPDVALGN